MWRAVFSLVMEQTFFKQGQQSFPVEVAVVETDPVFQRHSWLQRMCLLSGAHE
jgi:hypothetical protein